MSNHSPSYLCEVSSYLHEFSVSHYSTYVHTYIVQLLTSINITAYLYVRYAVVTLLARPDMLIQDILHKQC